MNQYITLHTLKKSNDEFSDFFNSVVTDFARATVSGAMPAKCIKTWNAVPHGKSYVFCLWQAEKPEDVEASLGVILDYVTVETWQVDEYEWAQIAQAAEIAG